MASSSSSKAQPWKAVFDYNNTTVHFDASERRNEVRGFEKGQPIVIGGQSPDAPKGEVIYDTGVKQVKQVTKTGEILQLANASIAYTKNATD